jgi:hypothetical protein
LRDSEDTYSRYHLVKRITTEYVRSVMREAPAPMAQALDDIKLREGRIIVVFRSPAGLAPKEVEGRVVECLLY